LKDEINKNRFEKKNHNKNSKKKAKEKRKQNISAIGRTMVSLVSFNFYYFVKFNNIVFFLNYFFNNIKK
jgi:hypothetical protein